MEFSMSITKGLGNQKHNNQTQKETTKNVNHDLTFFELLRCLMKIFEVSITCF